MRTKICLSVLTLFIAVSWLTAEATVRVTNLHLAKQGQFTQFTVECDGPFEFSHQIVREYENKPYRIVVDIKDAIHALPQPNYSTLPSAKITRIRTSQFSTDPEKVVRIVIDTEGELTYKIKSEGNYAVLHLNTPDEIEFSQWSATGSSQAAPVVAAETPKPAVMPAYPGKEGQTPKPVATGGDAASKQQSGQQATTATQPSVSESSGKGAQPQVAPPTKSAEVDPEILTMLFGSAEEPSLSPAQPAAPAKERVAPGAGQQKVADSAVSPKAPMPTDPKLDLTPPKVQKSGLPETKAGPNPTFAEEGDLDQPEGSTLGTPTVAQKSTKPAQAVEGVPDEAGEIADAFANEPSNDKPKSRTQEIRDKYRTITQPGVRQSDEDAGEEALTQQETAQPPSKVDKIRLKYKRGIRFVTDERDERRLAYEESQESDDIDVPTTQVGPYSEFLPERQIVVYKSYGRMDPFMPLVEDFYASSEPGKLPDVESLRLVGILQDRITSRALFQDFNGYSYILKQGDRVKNGFVLSIGEDRVTFQIRQYGWNRQVALHLESDF